MVSTPRLTPVTMPRAITLACVLLATHEPPGIDAVHVMPEPRHTIDIPDIVPGTVSVTTDSVRTGERRTGKPVVTVYK